MQFKNENWKIYKNEALLVILGLVYFFVLLKYYLIDYYVPDFRAYFQMALNGDMARDGFSSLFLWFASFAAAMPRVLTVFSLVLMTLAIINMSFFIKSLFIKMDFYYYICIAVLYSCGSFYYFYGKLFYDFPFTAFTYSVCLLSLRKIFLNLEKGECADKIWFFLCAGMGFMLSWKPYNVFLVAGLGLFMLGRKATRNYIWNDILKSVKKTLISFMLFMIGYTMGNYGLFIDAQATIEGIKAYPASFDFIQFLLSKARMQWDHVNDLPFNVSVMPIVAVVFFVIVLPILFKKFYYLFITLFISVCLYVYIEYFSPGYAWHGFGIGLLIVTFISFLFSDVQMEREQRFRWCNCFTAVFLGIQIVNCFFYYIPLQNRWYSTTEEAIAVMEENESEIYEAVTSMVAKTGDSYYMIDEAVKRYKPVAVLATDWKEINMKNTYLAATNIAFLAPLEATNYFDWTRLRQNERCTDDMSVCKYVVWIVPDCFKAMGDVAMLHLYDDYNIVDQIHGKGWTVYLYSVC